MLRNNNNGIIESNTIRDILKLVKHHSWVLLDLDNTVMEAIGELGSDQWFTRLIDQVCRLTPQDDQAIEKVIAVYTAVQHHIKTQVVEQDIVALIKTLQDIGIPVIGITARDHSLIDTTFRQLAENHIHFGRTRADHERQIELYSCRNPVVYHHGIIFCSGNDKGKSLKAFLSICDKHPKHVVMVDDKGKHLSHVQSLVESLGIAFDGVRYGYLDEKAKKVDMQAAHEQLAHIQEKLPQEIQKHIASLNITAVDVKLTPEKYQGYFADTNNKRVLEINVKTTAAEKDKCATPPANYAPRFFNRERISAHPKITVTRHSDYKP